MKLKSIKNLYKPLLILGLSTMFCLQPITNVNAAEEANHNNGTSVTLEGLTFGEHNGCVFSISGEGKSYCIQRGYPFRSLVSDVDMSVVDGQTLKKWAQSQENFKGWGKWIINGDHTDATYDTSQSTTHIPSSGDAGDGGESSDPDEEGDVTSTTGTDGAKDTYSPKVKRYRETLQVSQFFRQHLCSRCFSLFPRGFWHGFEIPIEFCCPFFRNRSIVVGTILF